MPFSPGYRLGNYAVIAPLGAGGMGEVYRARDTRLGREIALKVLPADVSADGSRRQRFEQEARAASALNHPNILSIYDAGSEGGVAFMVSELVEGESFRALIERGPVGLRKMLDIAVQVADGLAAAHAAGIVHRDIKPDNLMLTPEGRVKILDFGLAKQTPLSPRGDADATLTAAATQAGVILGTVAYMSPEQARGGTLDFRSDQFSFGLVLYELITGKKAFDRDTAAETMAAILRDEPPILNTPLGTAPPPVRWVVERCLAKDAVDRYSHTSDLYRELRGLREHLTETISQSATKVETPVQPVRRRQWTAIIGVAGLIAGLALALIIAPTDLGMERYRYVPFAAEEGYEGGAAWSPDGAAIAYSGPVNGVAQIFTRSLTAPTAVALTKSATSCTDPFWSPDGARVYYFSGSGRPSLWSVGVAGGAPEVVLPDVYTATLSPDGNTLAFLRYDSSDETTLRLVLWLSSPPGATPRRFDRAPISGMRYYKGALQFSPDGTKLGFWMLMWNGEPEFWVIPFPTGQPTQPFLSWREWVPIGRFRWLPDNRHVLFSYHRPQTTGTHLWIADTGSGKLQQVTSGTANETAPAISPDGRTVAFTAFESQGDVVQIPLEGAGMRPLVASSRNESGVEWSPSGLEYAYVTDRTGVPEIWLAETRTARTWPIVSQTEFGADTNLDFLTPRFSPDGQRVAFARVAVVQGKSGAIWIAPVAGGKPVRAVEESEENPQLFPSWSPDGNSIVFVNSRSGMVALATAAVGGGARPVIIKQKIKTGETLWSPKGDWILYSMPDSLSIISPDGKTDRVLSPRRPDLYAWSKDGARVYAIRGERQHYTLVAIDVPGGAEKTLSEFDLPAGSRLGPGLSLAPDGKTLGTTMNQNKGDIWLLQGFHSPGGILERLRRW
jgi:Tol biopolymer transport system component